MYVRIPGPGLGRAQTCGGVKPVNVIPTLSVPMEEIDKQLFKLWKLKKK